MGVTKTGIVSSSNIYESKAKTVHYNTTPGDLDSKSYTFTPTTGVNSCMREIIVHGELYPTNELMHARFKVTWNGFDTSNTSGDFGMVFQGYHQDSDGTTQWWTSLGSAANNIRNLRSLVLSSTSGSYIYDFTYNNTSALTHEGFRCDYSNGTATITFSDMIVIPEKYYVPESFQSGTPSFRMGKDYISAKEIYEL